MKSRILKILLAAIVIISGLVDVFYPKDKENSSCEVYTMNTDWGFYLGDTENESCKGGNSTASGLEDADYQAVSIPHIMRLEPKHCGGNIIYQGVGWYRRYFKLEKCQKGKNVYLDFEGVMMNCQVFLNGNKVEEHHGGYMGFEIDATKYIKWDKSNILELRVSAASDSLTPPGKPEGGIDFYYYSGIYRDVRLVYKNDLQITNPLTADTEAGGGIFVTYPEVSKEKAVVNVKTQVANKSTEAVDAWLVQELSDDQGNIVAKAEKALKLEGSDVNECVQDITVDNPRLWNPYNPNLYTLTTKLVKGEEISDEETTSIGIRTIKQTKDGFYINGEKLFLRGTNRHQCFPNVGDAASNSLHERDVLYIKKGGYNAVRAAHYTHDPAFLDACDKYGLLVIECIPGWQFWNNDPIFAQRLYEVGREMIRRDRNHPSIFLWETMLNETRYPKEIADSIQKIAHAEYPGDQMYTVGDYWGHQEVADCFDVYYKQVSKFPADGDVMTNNPADLISIAAHYSREWGDGAAEKPRASLAENEYEQFRQCRSRLECLDGRGYFDWCMLDANPNMAGHFSWCFIDIPRGLEHTTEYCGAVDLNRYPKFSYYMHQSMRDAHISQPGLFDGPMVHIASYNSNAALDSSAKEIWVFSNCDSVSLYRNDKLIGTITRQEAAENYKNIVNKGGSPAFKFKVDGYEAGTLKSVAYLDGKVSCQDEVTTASEPHHLNVIIPESNIQPIADGSDMIPVWIEVLDKDGNRVTDSALKIHISVEGEGALIGKDNDYAGIENQIVEGGVACCFVRTSKEAGKITISAEAEGLQTGKITIESQKAVTKEVKDGKHKPFAAMERTGATVDKFGNAINKPNNDGANNASDNNGTADSGVASNNTSNSKASLTENAESDIVISEYQDERFIPTKVSVTYPTSDTKYPTSNIYDSNDESWWISPSGKLPQSVTLEFDNLEYASAGRIRFQKDSSTYKYRVEVSTDGKSWQELFTKESTGWDLKPFKIGCEIKELRITFLYVSEGNPGLAEVTVYM